jgi:hypothetical protein
MDPSHPGARLRPAIALLAALSTGPAWAFGVPSWTVQADTDGDGVPDDTLTDGGKYSIPCNGSVNLFVRAGYDAGPFADNRAATLKVSEIDLGDDDEGVGPVVSPDELLGSRGFNIQSGGGNVELWVVLECRKNAEDECELVGGTLPVDEDGDPEDANGDGVIDGSDVSGTRTVDTDEDGGPYDLEVEAEDPRSGTDPDFEFQLTCDCNAGTVQDASTSLTDDLAAIDAEGFGTNFVAGVVDAPASAGPYGLVDLIVEHDPAVLQALSGTFLAALEAPEVIVGSDSVRLIGFAGPNSFIPFEIEYQAVEGAPLGPTRLVMRPENSTLQNLDGDPIFVRQADVRLAVLPFDIDEPVIDPSLIGYDARRTAIVGQPGAISDPSLAGFPELFRMHFRVSTFGPPFAQREIDVEPIENPLLNPDGSFELAIGGWVLDGDLAGPGQIELLVEDPHDIETTAVIPIDVTMPPTAVPVPALPWLFGLVQAAAVVAGGLGLTLRRRRMPPPWAARGRPVTPPSATRWSGDPGA